MSDIINKIDFILHEKKLTTKMRKRLADKSFVFSDERKYPIHDRKHGSNALARVKQFGTPEEKEKVKKAVCKKYKDFKSCKENNK
jgi:hypothetical protein